MRVFDLLTILVVGLMIGNEFAVSAFVNPAIWKNDDRAQASTLAASLGSFMPAWYALSLALLLAEAVWWRHSGGSVFCWMAVTLWAVTIVLTPTLLVPLNNRLARTPAHTPGYDWRREQGQVDLPCQPEQR